MDIHQYIKRRRVELEISINELARRLALYGYVVERQTVGHWERGRNKPPMDSPLFRRALALALEVDVNEMLKDMGYQITEDGRSHKANLAASIVDAMSPEKQDTALVLLEALYKGKQ